MTKPTGNPVGRPKTKEYSTLLARVPQDLVDRVKRYASVHRSTIAELIRDGLEWRITEGDPRNAFLYDMNHNEYSSNTETQTALEGMDPTPDMLDAEDLDTMPVEPTDRPPQTDERPGSTPVPPFDTTKHALGDLCKHHHDYHGTRQSLRRLADGECLECQRTRAQVSRQRKRQAGKEGAAPVAAQTEAAVDASAKKRRR